MENTKRTPEEFAAQMPTKLDGLHEAVRITNIGHANGRDLFNFAFKTEKSKGRNAVYSTKGEWGVAAKYSAGELVNVVISGGYISRMEKIKKGQTITAAQAQAQPVAQTATAGVEEEPAY